MKVSIVDFGAVANAEALQTDKIQAAIDHCFAQGGGTVIVPEGVWNTGDIRLRSNITLYLQSGAVLKGSTDPEEYFHYRNDPVEPLSSDQITDNGFIFFDQIPNNDSYQEDKEEYQIFRRPGSRWNNAIIRAIGADNVSIIGEKGSFIDGSNCYDALGEEKYRGPHGITFFYCRNVRFCGYTARDTGNWAHNISHCHNVSMEGVTVLAGHDGIHASVCTNLNIEKCEFYTGDDCVAGFANVNTHVSNCVLNSSCSAMRVGGTNALIEKCHIYGPGKYCFRGSMTDEEKKACAPSPAVGRRNNMLSTFTYYADYSVPIKTAPGNIVIADCRIHNSDRFLHFNYSGNERWQKQRPLESIEFRNITATDISMPLTAYGDAENKLTLKLEDVSISLREGAEDIDLIHACNYETLTLKNVTVSNFHGDCLVRTWSDDTVKLENVECGNPNADVKPADKPFFAKQI